MGIHKAITNRKILYNGMEFTDNKANRDLIKQYTGKPLVYSGMGNTGGGHSNDTSGGGGTPHAGPKNPTNNSGGSTSNKPRKIVYNGMEFEDNPDNRRLIRKYSGGPLRYNDGTMEQRPYDVGPGGIPIRPDHPPTTGPTNPTVPTPPGSFVPTPPGGDGGIEPGPPGNIKPPEEPKSFWHIWGRQTGEYKKPHKTGPKVIKDNEYHKIAPGGDMLYLEGAPDWSKLKRGSSYENMHQVVFGEGKHQFTKIFEKTESGKWIVRNPTYAHYGYGSQSGTTGPGYQGPGSETYRQWEQNFKNKDIIGYGDWLIQNTNRLARWQNRGRPLQSVAYGGAGAEGSRKGQKASEMELAAKHAVDQWAGHLDRHQKVHNEFFKWMGEDYENRKGRREGFEEMWSNRRASLYDQYHALQGIYFAHRRTREPGYRRPTPMPRPGLGGGVPPTPAPGGGNKEPPTRPPGPINTGPDRSKQWESVQNMLLERWRNSWILPYRDARVHLRQPTVQEERLGSIRNAMKERLPAIRADGKPLTAADREKIRKKIKRERGVAYFKDQQTREWLAAAPSPGIPVPIYGPDGQHPNPHLTGGKAPKQRLQKWHTKAEYIKHLKREARKHHRSFSATKAEEQWSTYRKRHVNYRDARYKEAREARYEKNRLRSVNNLRYEKNRLRSVNNLRYEKNRLRSYGRQSPGLVKNGALGTILESRAAAYNHATGGHNIDIAMGWAHPGLYGARSGRRQRSAHKASRRQRSAHKASRQPRR